MHQSIFVDWLAMHQEYPDGGLPKINSGCVWAMDQDGWPEWTTEKAITVEGSHDTKLRLRCDGYRVEVSGNIGRFHRPDNLFGYSYEECVDRWSDILETYGIPRFTPGKPVFYFGDTRMQWTGAINTQIDLTRNYCLFERQNLHSFMGWLGSQQRGRLKVGISLDGGTISWGEGSKYVYEIFYDKYLELQNHKHKNKYVESDVLDFCRDVGVGRHELKLKTRFLTQQGYRFMGGINMGMLIDLYRERSQLVLTDTIPFDEFNDIPAPYRLTAKDWRDGKDIFSTYKVRKYQMHRRELLKYGIDISNKCNVATLKLRIKHIEIMGLYAPDWYVKKYG